MPGSSCARDTPTSAPAWVRAVPAPRPRQGWKLSPPAGDGSHSGPRGFHKDSTRMPLTWGCLVPGGDHRVASSSDPHLLRVPVSPMRCSQPAQVAAGPQSSQCWGQRGHPALAGVCSRPRTCVGTEPEPAVQGRSRIQCCALLLGGCWGHQEWCHPPKALHEGWKGTKHPPHRLQPQLQHCHHRPPQPMSHQM